MSSGPSGQIFLTRVCEPNHPKQKRPIALSLQLGLLFTLIIHRNPFLSDTHICTMIIGFWVVIISFLLTDGREKVNNNEIFCELKKSLEFDYPRSQNGALRRIHG